MSDDNITTRIRIFYKGFLHLDFLDLDIFGGDEQ